MNKNKNLILLASLPLLLASCGGDDVQGGGDYYPSNPDFDVFTSVTELFNFVRGSALGHEAEHASTFERTLHVYEQGMFQVTEETTEMQGQAYSNKVSVATGTISTSKYGDPDGFLPDTETSHTFETICMFDDEEDMFYQVVDHDTDDKEDDFAMREKYKASNASDYILFTGTNTLANTWNYFVTFLAPNIVEGFDSIAPMTNNETGEVTFRVEDTRVESYSNAEVQTAIGFDFIFSKEGALKSHSFQLVETDITNANLPKKLASIGDSFTLGYEEKVAYEGGSLNPLDYFMTDYEIGLIARNSYDPDIHNVDPTKFPYGYRVSAETKTCVPEKALDTKLTIIDSSNLDVISRMDFMDGSSDFMAIAEGTSTLTVRSESGIEKKIEVTVDAPDMTGIEIKAYSTANFVGEETALYIYTNPDNTLDEYEVRALTPEIATLTQDDRGYYSGVNLKEGIAKFEVFCKRDPSIRHEVSYRVTTKLERDEVISRFASSTFTGDLPHEDGKNTVKDAVTVQILDETRATFTFNSDELGHYFEKGKAYEVTYEVNNTNKFSDFVEFWFSPIETSSPNGTKFIYDDIVARFYMNAIDYRFQIAMSDASAIYVSPLVFSGQLA